MGWWYYPVDRGTCWQPELCPGSLPGGRREPTQSSRCPLASTQMCAHVHRKERKCWKQATMMAVFSGYRIISCFYASEKFLNFYIYLNFYNECNFFIMKHFKHSNGKNKKLTPCLLFTLSDHHSWAIVFCVHRDPVPLWFQGLLRYHLQHLGISLFTGSAPICPG